MIRSLEKDEASAHGKETETSTEIEWSLRDKDRASGGVGDRLLGRRLKGRAALSQQYAPLTTMLDASLAVEVVTD